MLKSSQTCLSSESMKFMLLEVSHVCELSVYGIKFMLSELSHMCELFSVLLQTIFSLY